MALGCQPPDAASRSLGSRRPMGLVSFMRPSPAHANGDLWELWTVDVDGRNLRVIASLGEDLPVGAWSPDSRYIAFLGGGSALGGGRADPDGRGWITAASTHGPAGPSWPRLGS